MSRLFGTDGVRGKAGDYPLDHETVARVRDANLMPLRKSQIKFIETNVIYALASKT